MIPGNPRLFVRAGWCELAVSLPGWFLLLGGSRTAASPYLLLSLAAVPVGFLLLGAGYGRLPRSRHSDIGLRIAFLGIAFSLFLLGSWVGVTTGAEALRTSLVFCAMTASYLNLLAAGFLAAGAAAGKRGS